MQSSYSDCTLEEQTFSILTLITQWNGKEIRLFPNYDYILTTDTSELGAGLQLATQQRSVQSHPTSVRSNSDGSVCIVSQPSNDKLLYNQNECTTTRLKSMEAVSSVSTSNTFAFCAGEDQLIEFHDGFYYTYIPGVEVSNFVFND
ncbi:hypothetical protein ACTFIU_011199 [Dictyostelium citrinum]